MFSFLKKKKPEKTAAVEKNVELNPLDVNSIISYAKSKKPDITDEELVDLFKTLAKPDDDLEHLNNDGELPWGWHTANKETTDKMESEHNNHPAYTNWSSAYKGDPQVEIESLKTYLQYIEELQARCDSMGECFGFWCSVDLIGEGRKEWLEDRLADLETNKDAKIKEYEDWKEKQLELKAQEEYETSLTDEMMFAAIRQNEGMLQKDFCKLFPYPKAISNKLYWMAKEDKIERIKSGNSYILKVK